MVYKFFLLAHPEVDRFAGATIGASVGKSLPYVLRISRIEIEFRKLRKRKSWGDLAGGIKVVNSPSMTGAASSM